MLKFRANPARPSTGNVFLWVNSGAPDGPTTDISGVPDLTIAVVDAEMWSATMQGADLAVHHRPDGAAEPLRRAGRALRPRHGLCARAFLCWSRPAREGPRLRPRLRLPRAGAGYAAAEDRPERRGMSGRSSSGPRPTAMPFHLPAKRTCGRSMSRGGVPEGGLPPISKPGGRSVCRDQSRGGSASDPTGRAQGDDPPDGPGRCARGRGRCSMRRRIRPGMTGRRIWPPRRTRRRCFRIASTRKAW